MDPQKRYNWRNNYKWTFDSNRGKYVLQYRHTPTPRTNFNSYNRRNIHNGDHDRNINNRPQNIRITDRTTKSQSNSRITIPSINTNMTPVQLQNRYDASDKNNNNKIKKISNSTKRENKHKTT
eukprot:514851_1